MVWSENVCRLCGQISNTCHFIFKHTGKYSLEYKIKKCLNYCVFKDDFKPKEVCDDCYRKVDEFCDFVDICNSTNERFDSFLLSRTDWPQDKGFNDYNQQKSVIVNLKSNLENISCNEMSLYKDDILDNIRINEDVLQITQNPNIYSSNIQENMSNYISPISTYEPKNFSEDYFNTNCGTVLRHSSDFQVQHNPCPENEPIDYNYSSKDDYCQDPKETLNKTCTTYLDKYSDLSFIESKLDYTNYSKVTKDMNKVNNISQINLISIETIQSNLKLNNIHENIEKRTKSKKSYKCLHCEKIFVRRITLNSHMAIHTNNKPYSCDLCKRTFAIKSNLTNHQKIHTDQYKCTICLKTFSVPSKLTRHIRTHTKEKPFLCDFENCKKSFSDKSNLDEHKMIHKNLRNLKCSTCDKCFKTKNQLKSHKYSHKHNVYRCDICKVNYKYKTGLVLHMKKHNGYFCPYCNLNCEQLGNLIKHRKNCENKNS